MFIGDTVIKAIFENYQYKFTKEDDRRITTFVKYKLVKDGITVKKLENYAFFDIEDLDEYEWGWPIAMEATIVTSTGEELAINLYAAVDMDTGNLHEIDYDLGDILN